MVPSLLAGIFATPIGIIVVVGCVMALFAILAKDF